MHKFNILVIAAISIVLAACGDNGATDAASKAAGKAMGAASDAADKAMGAASDATDKAMDAASGAADKAMSAAGDAAASMSKAVKISAGEATSYVDHSKDEMEFQLKSSIDGWKSLMGDVKDSAEVAKIKEHLAGLQKQLDSL
jgi:colicin import membrane protein